MKKALRELGENVPDEELLEMLDDTFCVGKFGTDFFEGVGKPKFKQKGSRGMSKRKGQRHRKRQIKPRSASSQAVTWPEAYYESSDEFDSMAYPIHEMGLHALALENLCYQLVGDALQRGCSANDKLEFENVVQDTLAWLDMNPLAEENEVVPMRKILASSAAFILKGGHSSNGATAGNT